MKRTLRAISWLLAAAILTACAGTRDDEQAAARQQTGEETNRTRTAGEISRDVSQAEPVAAEVAVPKADVEIDSPVSATATVAAPPAREAEAKSVVVTGGRVATGHHMKSQTSNFAPPAVCCVYGQPANTERYQHLDENPVRLASEHPVSTFSIDVDTGSYANVRRYLNAGQLPPQDAVRVEEMINYFDYAYAPPAGRDTPFRVATELAPAPWNAQAYLLRIGIKGYDVEATERPPANLVFLIDVSGSMQSPDKLPLLKNAFRLLTDQLTARDRVSMVVYAGSTGMVLEPTPGDRKYRIREAIAQLEAGGSTAGAAGIERAYELAHATFLKGGINRVVLATDGDFNVGVVSFEALVDMAERQRASGVALTTLGFGTGNYNDQLLERLADAGNGNYAYVDTLSEARKVLVSELSSTLFTIAKDVKIQVEFNPSEVLEYRLVGYENRMLAREDFNNDKVDAGEVGAGHRVTALYEIVPVGGKGRVEPLRYAEKTASGAGNGEIAHVRVRYKLPDGDSSRLLEYPIARSSLVSESKVSTDLRFAASVAAFGQLLRGGKYLGEFDYAAVESLAKGALAQDDEGYRREFVSLVKLAASLAPEAQQKVSRIAQ